MKVLLIQPNYDAHVIHPPLGLGYLASFIREKGHVVKIFDGTLKNAGPSDFENEVKLFNPEVVGVSVLSRGYEKVREIIKLVRKVNKRAIVVIGGTQLTAAPKEVLSDLKGNFGVIGEGEITFSELLAFLNKEGGDIKKVEGIVFRDKSGHQVITAPRKLIENLDSLPFPAWDLMPPSQYRIVPILEPAQAFPVAPIMTSRGCPFNCSFCASNITWGKRIRFRSPENVMREIILLKEQFGVKELHFADDNFTMDIKRAEKICALMISSKINLPWQCPNGVRIDRLTQGLLDKMKKAGCYSVGLGIESGSQKILNKAEKNLDLKIVPEVLKRLKNSNIESYGFFILGLPGETKDTIRETINFALTNNFDRAWFNIFTPYPGSKVFNSWLGKRAFSAIDWDKHDCSTGIMASKDLSTKDLEKWQKIALLKFYLRPNKFLGLIRRIGYKEIVTLLMSRFFSKFSKKLFNSFHKRIIN